MKFYPLILFSILLGLPFTSNSAKGKHGYLIPRRECGPSRRVSSSWGRSDCSSRQSWLKLLDHISGEARNLVELRQAGLKRSSTQETTQQRMNALKEFDDLYIPGELFTVPNKKILSILKDPVLMQAVLLENGIVSLPELWREFASAAAAEGLIEPIQFLINIGFDINEEYLGVNALHIAVLRNRTDLVKFLLSHGADINKPRSGSFRADGRFMTPLEIAEYAGYFEMVQLLIENGAQLSSRQHRLQGEATRLKSWTIALETLLKVLGK
jgi:hypothetical protein